MPVPPIYSIYRRNLGILQCTWSGSRGWRLVAICKRYLPCTAAATVVRGQRRVKAASSAWHAEPWISQLCKRFVDPIMGLWQTAAA